MAEVNPASVTELGGWDGWMSSAYPDVWWTNFEICAEAAASREYPRYWAPKDIPFRWWRFVGPGAAVVSIHSLEHLDAADAAEFLEWSKPAALYLEVPLSEKGREWTGYVGTHVLTEGLEFIRAIRGIPDWESETSNAKALAWRDSF
jgi:hypothetical protein